MINKILIPIFCSTALIIALVSQHIYNMLPCPWCILQRFVIILILITSLLSIKNNNQINKILIFIYSSIGFLLGAYQYFIVADSSTCFLSVAQKIINFSMLGDLFPNVFGVWAGCGDKSYLFNIDYAIWSMLFFILLFLLNIRINKNFKIKK